MQCPVGEHCVNKEEVCLMWHPCSNEQKAIEAGKDRQLQEDEEMLVNLPLIRKALSQQELIASFVS